MGLRGNIPVSIEITNGKAHDVNILDGAGPGPGAFYITDKGHYGFGRLYRVHRAGAFFVVRAKRDLEPKRACSGPVDKPAGPGCGRAIKLTGAKTSTAYPEKLGRAKFSDRDKPRAYGFLANNFEAGALGITKLYRNRWQIELFFKWVRRHLKIKKFWGRSQNAVKAQIWIAVRTCLIIATLKKKLNLDKSPHGILQVLSVSVFDRTPVNQLLTDSGLQKPNQDGHNQLILFDL